MLFRRRRNGLVVFLGEAKERFAGETEGVF